MEHDEDTNRISLTTWALIAGLVLFNIGCFINTSLIDFVFKGIWQVIDIRRHPWWYFLILAITAVFSYFWYRIYIAFEENDYDPFDEDKAKRFLRLTIFITAQLWGFMFLHFTGLLKLFIRPFGEWVRIGTYSNMALFSLVCIALFFAITVYFVKEWLALALVRK